MTGRSVDGLSLIGSTLFEELLATGVETLLDETLGTVLLPLLLAGVIPELLTGAT
jgi:hypothetical protein